MTQAAQFPQVFPALFHVETQSAFLLADGASHDSRIIDISDPLSDPENPLPDFGASLLISFTRVWRLAWSVRLDLTGLPWAGVNRSDLTLEVIDYTARQAVSEASEDLVRLFIPGGANKFVYTGSRTVHSIEARVHIENRTGADVLLDFDIWAKAW